MSTQPIAQPTTPLITHAITQPDWQLLALDIPVPARPPGLWTRVIDYVGGPRKIKIVAQAGATWTLSAGVTPSPVGCLVGLTETTTPPSLFPAALRGALIGKVGGSAADNTTQVGSPGVLTHPTTIPTPFGVGDYYILELGADKRGPLFLTMNDSPTTFNNHDGQIKVSIYWAL